jgi:hypothetical protein
MVLEVQTVDFLEKWRIEMTAIPENTVTQKDLEEWYGLQDQLRRIKAAEILLRGKIFKGLFKNPVEGTNTLPLDGGWVIKAKRVINRDIDEASLQANVMEDPNTHMSRLTANGIHPQQLIRWKPELILKAYRLLSEEQVKIFDECLIIKDGSPALEIVLPASAKKDQTPVPEV